MKVFNHNFKGYGTHDSSCKVHVFSYKENNIIIFEDIDKGTSITNVAGQIATEIMFKEKLDPEKTRFIEAYPYLDNNIDEVVYDYDDVSNKLTNPFWREIEDKELILLINKALKNEQQSEQKIDQGNK